MSQKPTWLFSIHRSSWPGLDDIGSSGMYEVSSPPAKLMRLYEDDPCLNVKTRSQCHKIHAASTTKLHRNLRNKEGQSRSTQKPGRAVRYSAQSLAFLGACGGLPAALPRIMVGGEQLETALSFGHRRSLASTCQSCLVLTSS